MRKTTKMVAVLAAMSVMVLGAATMVSADKKEGWAKEGSDWYYYVDGDAIVNEWALSGSDWYFLNEDGKMATEEFVNHDDKEVVEASDVNVNDNFYYVGKDGAVVTGWLEIDLGSSGTPYDKADKTWYYFGADGVMYVDEWVLSNNVWYFLSDGTLVDVLEGQMVEYEYEGDYYLGKGGAMITGWYEATDKDVFAEDFWVYAGTNGKPVKEEWKKVNGSWYYFGAISGTATGSVATDDAEMNAERFIKEGTHTFYLKKSGAMSTGWEKIDGVYYYSKSDGVIFQNKVEKISNKYYFFNADGKSLDESNDKWAVKDAAGIVGATYANQEDAEDAADSKAMGTTYTLYKLGTGTTVTYTN